MKIVYKNPGITNKLTLKADGCTVKRMLSRSRSVLELIKYQLAQQPGVIA
jgi:hypothetical protein